jgi:hypothetical protein
LSDRCTHAADNPAERAPMTSHGLLETTQKGEDQAPDTLRAWAYTAGLGLKLLTSWAEMIPYEKLFDLSMGEH